jgi:hypothetical protein
MHDLQHNLYARRAIQLVAVRTGSNKADFVFAAVIAGSGECGAYGFWVMRVDASDVRLTPPIAGCFSLLTEGDGGVVSPGVQWGPPLRLAISAYDRPGLTYVLDERRFVMLPASSAGR